MKKKFILLLAIPTLLVGCAKDDEEKTNSTNIISAPETEPITTTTSSTPTTTKKSTTKTTTTTKLTCNYKKGDVTASKPNSACKYEELDLEWAFLLKHEDDESATFEWVLESAWADDGAGHKTEVASETSFGLPYKASMFSKFRPTNTPDIDDNARIQNKKVYLIK